MLLMICADALIVNCVGLARPKRDYLAVVQRRYDIIFAEANQDEEIMMSVVRIVGVCLVVSLVLPTLRGQEAVELYRQALSGEDKLAKEKLASACDDAERKFSVQLWALANYYYAEAKHGLKVPVEVVPFLRKGRVLYRVISGCFTDRETAESVRQLLREELEKGAHVLELGEIDRARKEMARLVARAERQEMLGHALTERQMVALFQLYEAGTERKFIWSLLLARPEARPLVLEVAVRFNLAGGVKIVPEKKEIGFFLEKAETDAALYYLEELARKYPQEVFRSAKGMRHRLREKTYHAIMLRCRVAGAFDELYRACLADARQNYLKPSLDDSGRNRSLHFQLGLDLLYKRREEFRAALGRDLSGEDAATRLYCAEYLGRMGDMRGYQKIIDGLQEADSCLAAIRALGELGGREALGLLEPFSGAAVRPELVRAARQASDKINDRFKD